MDDVRVQYGDTVGDALRARHVRQPQRRAGGRRERPRRRARCASCCAVRGRGAGGRHRTTSRWATAAIQRGGSPERGVAIADLARWAYHRPERLPEGMEPLLEAVATYDAAPGTGTFANAAQMALVEVDAETGVGARSSATGWSRTAAG